MPTAAFPPMRGLGSGTLPTVPVWAAPFRLPFGGSRAWPLLSLGNPPRPTQKSSRLPAAAFLCGLYSKGFRSFIWAW